MLKIATVKKQFQFIWKYNAIRKSEKQSTKRIISWSKYVEETISHTSFTLFLEFCNKNNANQSAYYQYFAINTSQQDKNLYKTVYVQFNCLKENQKS